MEGRLALRAVLDHAQLGIHSHVAHPRQLGRGRTLTNRSLELCSTAQLSGRLKTQDAQRGRLLWGEHKGAIGRQLQHTQPGPATGATGCSVPAGRQARGLQALWPSSPVLTTPKAAGVAGSCRCTPTQWILGPFPTASCLPSLAHSLQQEASSLTEERISSDQEREREGPQGPFSQGA